MVVSADYVSKMIGQKCVLKGSVYTCVDVFKNSKGFKYVNIKHDSSSKKHTICYRHFLRLKRKLEIQCKTNVHKKYDVGLKKLNIIF